jgi:hypothetical protein
MNHVLYGATLPFLMGLLLYLKRGGRASPAMLIAVPLSMAFMAVWAVAPDLPRMLGAAGLHLPFPQNLHSDLFLWHVSLDQLETSPAWYSVLERDSSWYAVGIALEAAALIAAALRELFRKEPG